MPKNSTPYPVRRFLARCAMDRIRELPERHQADLLEFVSTFLEGEDSEIAKLAAFATRKAEQHQLDLNLRLVK